MYFQFSNGFFEGELASCAPRQEWMEGRVWSLGRCQLAKMIIVVDRISKDFYMNCEKLSKGLRLTPEAKRLRFEVKA